MNTQSTVAHLGGLCKSVEPVRVQTSSLIRFTNLANRQIRLLVI